MARNILREFQLEAPKQSYSTCMQILQKYVGKMYRIGGRSRVYDVQDQSGSTGRGVIYGIGSGTAGIGVVWDNEEGVRTVYLWDVLNIDKSPDYAVDIVSGSFEEVAATLAKMLRSKKMGNVSITPNGQM